MTGKLTHLLPCHFCGCTKVPKRQGNGIGDYWLECFECGASTRLREDGAGMEKDWNRRPAPTQQPSGEVMEKKILELADKYRIDYGGDYSRNAKEHELDLLAFVRAVLPSPTQHPSGEVTHGNTTMDECMASLLDRLEVAEVYADRYRYLRERPLDAVSSGGVFAGKTPDNVVLNGADLDAAIDAARTQRGES